MTTRKEGGSPSPSLLPLRLVSSKLQHCKHYSAAWSPGRERERKRPQPGKGVRLRVARRPRSSGKGEMATARFCGERGNPVQRAFLSPAPLGLAGTRSYVLLATAKSTLLVFHLSLTRLFHVMNIQNSKLTSSGPQVCFNQHPEKSPWPKRVNTVLSVANSPSVPHRAHLWVWQSVGVRRTSFQLWGDTVHIGYNAIGYSAKSDIVPTAGWSRFPYSKKYRI